MSTLKALATETLIANARLNCQGSVDPDGNHCINFRPLTEYIGYNKATIKVTERFGGAISIYINTPGHRVEDAFINNDEPNRTRLITMLADAVKSLCDTVNAFANPSVQSMQDELDNIDREITRLKTHREVVKGNLASTVKAISSLHVPGLTKV